MAVPYFDVCKMERPDEFIVMAVPKDGPYRGMWREMTRHESRVDAHDYADYCIKSGYYSHVGIEPHVKAAGIFQTSPLQEVWAE